MKAASVKDIKQELREKTPSDLLELCLRLSKFKKENKELLTYLLFEASNEEAYINSIKSQVDELFLNINTKSYYYIKKSIRKILSLIKKYIRYSKHKETEVELLLYFCAKLSVFKPSYKRSVAMKNLYNRQIEMAKKAILTLHEDLQFDFNERLEALVI